MKILVALILIFSGLYGGAQTPQKIGHADWDYIFSQLPEYKKIENELKVYEAQLQNQLRMKSQEFEVKIKAYRSLPEETPDAIKKDRETELTYLEANLQKFQQEARIAMEKKQTDLVKPVFEKVGKAIEQVAVEDGYTYIINPQMIGGGDILLFADSKHDISGLVLKKLGIQVTTQPKNPGSN